MSHRVGAYVVGSLLISVVSDFSTKGSQSNSFFADKNNWINLRMVKWGFGWTLVLLTPFVAVIGQTVGCGSEGVGGKNALLRSSLARLGVALACWAGMYT